MLVTRQEIRLADLRVNRAALMFLLATVISLAAGHVRFIPLAVEGASVQAQIGGWTLYAFSIGIFLLVGHRVRDLKWLQTITWVFLLLAGFYIFTRLSNEFSPIRRLLFVDPQSFGSMYWIWLCSLGFAQLISNRDLRWTQRILLALLVTGSFYVNWSQTRDWVSGWMPPLVAVLVVLWLRSWRIALPITLAGGLFFLSSIDAFNAQVLDATQQYSIDSRAATWPIMLQLIRASPIIGLGFANYYYYTPIFPLMGWYVRFNSHNNYVDMTVQTGVLGIGLFIWFVTEIGFLALNLRKKVPQGFATAYVDACLGGLAALLVSGWLGDWFLPFLYNISFRGFRVSIFGWMFLGGLVALANMYMKEKKGEEA
jgi:hypothetical protein